MYIETGWNSAVVKHPDGRVSITRAEPRTGLYLYLDLTEREQEALRKALSDEA